MKSPRRTGFRAHIEKRRRRGWFCVTREYSVHGGVWQGFHGPFSKRDAKAFKASAKKSYEESRKGQ